MDQFRVVVLGPSRSGKTVFLACMYNNLSLPKHGFFLACDDEQQIRQLLDIYNHIANTNDESWPPGNRPGKLLTAEFTCTADVGGTQYPAFRFSYLDYAGERFEQNLDGVDPNREFGAALRQATSVIGMIDGWDMLELMDGKLTNDGMRVRYGAILRVMLKYTSGKPIHFILTKWDLFERRGLKLDRVAARLREVPEFRDCFASRRHSAIPIRLIPVTSIGEKFAEPDETGRGMKKIKGASPEGYNLAMPLACAMYDNLQVVIERSRIQARRQANRRQRISLWWLNRHNRPFLEVLRRMDFDYVEKVAMSLTLTPLERAMLFALVMTAKKGRDVALRQLERANAERDPASAVGVDVLNGIEYTFVSFTALVDELDRISGSRLVFD